MGSKVGSWSQGVQGKVDIASSVVHGIWFFKLYKYQKFSLEQHSIFSTFDIQKKHFLTSVFFFTTSLHVTLSRMPWRLAPQLMRSCNRQSLRPKRREDSSTRRGFQKVKWCFPALWSFPCCLQLQTGTIPPPKFNIAPEKWWLEDYFPIGKVTFQGLLVYSLHSFRLNQAALARLTAAEQSGVTLATTGRDVPVAGKNKTKARGKWCVIWWLALLPLLFDFIGSWTCVFTTLNIYFFVYLFLAGSQVSFQVSLLWKCFL